MQESAASKRAWFEEGQGEEEFCGGGRAFAFVFVAVFDGDEEYFFVGEVVSTLFPSLSLLSSLWLWAIISYLTYTLLHILHIISFYVYIYIFFFVYSLACFSFLMHFEESTT